MNEILCKNWTVGTGIEEFRIRKSIADLQKFGLWSYAYDTRPYAYEMACRGKGRALVRAIRVPVRRQWGGTCMGGSHTRMSEGDDVFNVETSLVIRVRGG